MVHKALLLLKKVPKGKVVSYGELARRCRTSPRAIGMVMKNNKQPDRYPCYKAIKSDGKIGGYSGIGGVRKKTMILRKDGIEIKNGKIDKKYLHKFRL